MSVLIKGMDMPANCIECRFGYDGKCFAHQPFWFSTPFKRFIVGEEKDCPLVEVPTPHSDLIDREELLNDAGGVYTARPEEAQKIQHEINKVLFAIQDAPTVIEAEE